MSKPPWCRLYSEVLSDRKIEYICRKTQQPKVVILGAWTTFLALANDSPQRGVLLLTDEICYDTPDLAEEMGIDVEQAHIIICAFIELGLLTVDCKAFHVTNFNKRNFTSDNSAERVRAWRAKQGDEGEGEVPNDYEKSNGDVTPQDSYSNSDATPSEAETETQTEAKTDSDNAPTARKKQKLTTGQRKFLDAFGGKRFKTNVQRDAVLEMEQEHGTTKLLEGATWAAKRGMNVGQAIVALETALPKWGQPKPPKAQSEPASTTAIRGWLEDQGVEVRQ